jgi:hypothetical protein
MREKQTYSKMFNKEKSVEEFVDKEIRPVVIED